MRLAILLTIAVLSAATAAATPHAYVGATGGILVLCTADEIGFDIGGVCIPPGHLAGPTTITITDAVSPHVSAFVCSDENGNAICGDEGEGVAFCDTVTFDGGLAEILIFLDGPLFGNPLFSACGFTYSGGVIGVVDHT